MVTFVLTRRGYDNLRNRGSVPSPLWVASDVLTALEIEDLLTKGVDLTYFTRQINISDPAAIDDALYTIAEHHPGEQIEVVGNDV